MCSMFIHFIILSWSLLLLQKRTPWSVKIEKKSWERWNKVVQNKLRPAETETHSQPDECLNKLLFTQNIYSFVSVMSLFVEQTVFTIVTHFKFLVRDTKQELDLLPLHFLTLCTFTKQIILALHSNYNREMEQREEKVIRLRGKWWFSMSFKKTLKIVNNREVRD